MKYNDINDVETEIKMNDYVVNEVKPKKSLRAPGFNFKRKSGRKLSLNRDLLIVPLLMLTAVSLGFMIAQIAQLAGLSAATGILSFIS